MTDRASIAAAAAGLDLRAAVIPVWMAGVGLVLLMLALERARLATLARRSRCVTDGPVIDSCQAACREAGLRRTPRIHLGPDRMMPMTWGVLKPVVLLPSTIEGWPESRRRAVLRHEIAHVRRRDDAVQVLATVAAALHWFNPLAWLALRRLRIEREYACDDEVLRYGGSASAYAAELLAVAARFKAARTGVLIAQAMARSSGLQARVLAVLEVSRRRRGLTPRLAATGTATALLLALPLADVGTAGSERFDEEARRAPQAATSCWQHSGTSSSSTRIDDDEWRHTWRGRGCDAEIRVQGELEFDAAFEHLVGISEGGTFRLVVDEAGTSRQLDVTRPSGGDARFVWRVNGTVAPFDDAARDWLSGILPTIFRETGLAAEPRTLSLFAREGADGVLREVGSIRSSSARGRYLTTLLAQSGLDDDALVRVLRETGRVTSTSTRVRILSRFDDHHGNRLLDGQVGAAFWETVGSVDSTSNLRNLLLDVVEGEPAESALLGRVIDEAAAGIGSNSTRASFLRSLLRTYPDIAESGPAAARYWDLVNRIGSSSTMSDFLLAITDGREDDSRLLDLALETATSGISSSSGLGEFLVAFAERHRGAATGRLEDALLVAASGISSRSSRARAVERLQALGVGRPMA